MPEINEQVNIENTENTGNAEVGTNPPVGGESQSVQEIPMMDYNGVQIPSIESGQWELEEMRAFLDNGTVPDRFLNEQQEDDGANAETGDQANADADADADAQTNTGAEFQFTENADAETFRAEAEAYLETLEMPESLKQVIEHFKTAATTAETKIAEFEALGDFEIVSRTNRAFEQMLVARQDAETGEFVPDTSALISLLEKEYPNETEQLILDINSSASKKYAGMTVFQEFIKDGFGLNEKSLSVLDSFLNNGGQMPIPSFVPPGIDARNAEAYWHSLERETIQEQVETALLTIQSEHSTDAEKVLAKQSIAQLNAKLAQIQNGFDADRRQKTEDARIKAAAAETFTTTVNTNFITAVNEISQSLANQVAKSLAFVEGNAAGTVADGVTALVRGALSEREFEAAHNRNLLKERGIVHDWNKGRELLDKLYTIEEKLLAQQSNRNTNPRALEITQRDKREALKALQTEQKEIVAKIVSSISGSANKTLEKKIETAPKVKAVRAKAATVGASPQMQKNYAQYTDDDLRDPKVLSKIQAELDGAVGGYVTRADLFGKK